MNYQDVGVNIEHNDQFVDLLGSICKDQYSNQVIAGIGGFCSLYQLGDQLLAASTDGIGTKSILANELAEFGYLKTIGIDLVAMVANDIITTGAKPLFMLDYYGIRSLNTNSDQHEQIINGIIEGCKQANCCLIGGETSEMPEVFNHFDLVGFGIGLVEKSKLLGQHKVKAGDHVIGIASSGPHSNGFTLIRKAFENFDWYNDPSQRHREIMFPTKIYVKLVQNLLNKFDQEIHAIAHITGGGLTNNTSRVVPKNLALKVRQHSWPIPDIFYDIQRRAQIISDELLKVFNCGIGLTLIVDQHASTNVINAIEEFGDRAWCIGLIDYN